MPDQRKKIRCAIIGYGPTFNWGFMHALWIRAVEDMQLVAICDKNPECTAKAKLDFPEADICPYTDLRQMLARDDIDLVSVVTPHNTHATLAKASLLAGKHTLVEKPMCLHIAEATEMIETAKKVNKTLAVFHNRRHDGNVRAIKELIEHGTIGDVFHIELSACGYASSHEYRQKGSGEIPWRLDKTISGGAFYDWGAHAIDWVLSMTPSQMANVTGFFHKLLWPETSTETSPEISNEDQTRAIIRFENGCVADIMTSRIAYFGKPLWYILGTKGAIIDTGQGAITGYTKELIGPSGGSLKLKTSAGEKEVPYKESDWLTFYVEMANHLKYGAPVPVSGEDGRRVITVLETAEKSAKSGRSEEVPFR